MVGKTASLGPISPLRSTLTNNYRSPPVTPSRSPRRLDGEVATPPGLPSLRRGPLTDWVDDRSSETLPPSPPSPPSQPASMPHLPTPVLRAMIITSAVCGLLLMSVLLLAWWRLQHRTPKGMAVVSHTRVHACACARTHIHVARLE